MTWRSRLAGLAIAVAIIGIAVGCSRSSGANPDPAPTSSPPTNQGLTAADAARTAADQMKQLPPTAVQVDCAPGVPTLPIFTTLSGVAGTKRLHVLADGRCFTVPAEQVLVEPVDP